MNTELSKTVAGFLSFVREQGVIGLAIGVILGGAVGKLVTSLVNDIVLPCITLVVGSPEGMQSLAWHGITYGKFIAALVDFVLIAAVVYFGVKMLGLDRIDSKKTQ